MANIKSAKKRISVIEAKTQRNKRVKAHLKEILKGFSLAVAEGNKQEARDYLALAEKRLLQAGAKGTIHKNAASRKASRITQQFIKAFGQEALLLKANPPAIPTPEDKAARKAEREARAAAALARKKGGRKASTPAPAEESAPTIEEEAKPVEEIAEAATEESPDVSDATESESGANEADEAENGESDSESATADAEEESAAEADEPVISQDDAAEDTAEEDVAAQDDAAEDAAEADTAKHDGDGENDKPDEA
jgi:small subunit ribosomal protein S20